MVNASMELVNTVYSRLIEQNLDCCKFCFDTCSLVQPCSCQPGYEGRYCDQKVDFCHPSPCLNGGSCIARNNSAVCTCATGYFGARCQQNVSAFYH
ncbi:unnamed protein product [Anisakis simplex]|uniref:EGF-like domain-containing protein n=1 Tax=Anisakis simplex TaxID=6269 RepID=A0A0M3JFJ9_ANISI|nr:unnamed protein product [Anisakis simplex]